MFGRKRKGQPIDTALTATQEAAHSSSWETRPPWAAAKRSNSPRLEKPRAKAKPGKVGSRWPSQLSRYWSTAASSARGLRGRLGRFRSMGFTPQQPGVFLL